MNTDEKILTVIELLNCVDVDDQSSDTIAILVESAITNLREYYHYRDMPQCGERG